MNDTSDPFFSLRLNAHSCDQSPNYSSTSVTATDFVFTGVMNGEFQVLDAETGKVLWSFQTPSGMIGHPVTWERNGKQWAAYIAR